MLKISASIGKVTKTNYSTKYMRSSRPQEYIIQILACGLQNIDPYSPTEPEMFLHHQHEQVE